MKKEETYCRLLPMAGAYNMRDLGGYRTVYGKCVKWKMLFRSDDMNKLTAMDLDYLSLLPLRTVIDFRSEAEKNAAIDRLPQTVSKHILLTASSFAALPLVCRKLCPSTYPYQLKRAI